MNAYVIADIAVTLTCSAILAVAAWLRWKAVNDLAEAQRILVEARALLEREAHPLRVVDGGKP